MSAVRHRPAPGRERASAQRLAVALSSLAALVTDAARHRARSVRLPALPWPDTGSGSGHAMTTETLPVAQTFVEERLREDLRDVTERADRIKAQDLIHPADRHQPTRAYPAAVEYDQRKLSP